MKKRKAYGYVRGWKYKGLWTNDCSIQAKQIREYAEANSYDLVKIEVEDLRIHLGKKKQRGYGDMDIMSAMRKKCEEENAALLFLNIGRFRRNLLLSRFLEIFRKSIKINKSKKAKLRNYKFVEIPASKETMEAISLHTRYEKYDKRNRQLQRKIKNQYPSNNNILNNDNDIITWQKTNNIKTKQLNNFKYLYKGTPPIFEVIQKNLDLKPQALADLINDNYYLTVTGQRWTRHNVRKTISLIQSDIFQSYIKLREELGPESMHIKF